MRKWVLLFFAVSFCVFPIQSGDVMMYLTIARDFILEGEWRQIDVHNYLYPATDQVLHWHHEYLSALMFYGAWWVGGFPALILFKTLLIITTVWIVLRDETDEPAGLWIGLGALAIYAASFRFIERSSLFSDALSALTFVTLRRESRLTNALLIKLGLIFWLWIQLHPGFPFGLALVVLWAVQQRQFSPRWIFVPAVMLLNPDFADGFLYPFRFAFSEAEVFRRHNYEWLPAYHPIILFTREMIAFWIFSLATALLLILARAWREAAFALLAFLAAAQAVRFVPSAAMVMLICMRRPARDLFPKSVEQWLGRTAASVLIVISAKNLIFGYSSSAGFRLPGFGLDDSVFPSKTIEVLRQLPKTPIYNSHDFGAYLLWLNEKPVFHHGFVTDLAFYQNEVIGSLTSSERFFAAANKYHWQVLLVDRNSAYARLYPILAPHPEWKIVAEDAAAYLIVRQISPP